MLRVSSSNVYKETHVWYVLYNIISPGAYLNAQGKRIGDLGLSKVVTNQKGYMKVIPQGVFPNDSTVSQRYGKQDEKYIDPEVVKKIENYEEISAEEL